MSPGRGALLVVGSANLDIAVTTQRLPGPGETVLGDSVVASPGGKGANQAVAAARLGADVIMIGAVGRDDRAEPALELLAAAGVDLTRVARLPEPTGTALIEVDANGENSIIVVSGANAAITPAMIDPAALAGAAVVLGQGEIPADTTLAAARAARDAGTRWVLNLAPVIDIDPEAVTLADPLVVNEHEGAGALALLSVEPPPADDHEALVAALLAAGVRSVALTLGGAGALLGARDGITRVAAPTVEVVDSTGAGDAFTGALAGALAGGADLVAAVRHAVRVGAFAVTRPGTQLSYPSADDPLP
ncbi:ribokinase [Naumannella cuiyingiana]|uniref:Ribokinase n=1 Tax=Naumannella cuiyingiana TaxID=1347891 RepID=A0A7Z0D876_9ACTN|nr:ribokinase [Naumannella cuiyingiana]NYI70682.1 ribokinase [Naumannella cuiyingiana]